MANIMSLKSLRNKPSRNGFDLSFKKNFTAKVGELLPVMCKEVLPGDSFKINLKAFTRTQPINTAAYARMKEYYDFFFVPYELLWNKAFTVLTQMYDNPQHAVSIDPTQNFVLNGEMPYFTCKDVADYLHSLTFSEGSSNFAFNYFGLNRAPLTVKLLEYLGYGNFEHYITSPENTWETSPMMANLNMNIYGLAAYQKIYADYFRDAQWERISPSTFNFDYMNGQSMQIGMGNSNFVSYYNLFDLRYCNWQKDLFHGVLPRQQYGDVATVNVDFNGGWLRANEMYQTPRTTPEATVEFNSHSVRLNTAGNVGAGQAESNISSSFSILALRQAEFLQKWKEIAQSANKDYKDQIEKHWGVSVGDAYSEMCQYLGGISSSIDINEVVNTNITGNNAADIAGKGVGVNNGVINFNSDGKYGILMCIYHCLPMIDYTTDLINPALTKVNATDYAIPEFDRVGMQAVPLVHLMNPLQSKANAPYLNLGYAPRYIDYKTDVDSSVGGFKRTLKSWVISYDNQSVIDQFGNLDPNNEPSPSTAPMNYTYFKVNPNSVDPIFAVEANSSVDTDQLLCSSFFDVKVVRNLDTDGLPY